MNLAAGASPSRRVRTLGTIVAVVGAGFVLAALAVAVVSAVTDQPVPAAGVVAFSLVAVLTLAVTALVAWTFTEDAPEPAAAAEVGGTSPLRLLDDVRHELKTPITIVRGHLEVMDAGDVDDVESIRQLGIAELDRMSRLISDIDLLASVEAGPLTMAEVDLAELTRRASELVSVIPGHAWTVEHTAGDVILGDADRLLQAWLQLADNAAKYAPADTPIELGSAVHAAGVQLWVRDHGPGIPAAGRHRIFRRFDRGGARRTGAGSGLGLAIVEAITAAHRGRCLVAETPGGGATFTIEIPVGTRSELPGPVRAGDVVLQRRAAG